MDSRIQYIIGMYRKIYPDMEVTPKTLIKGTSIEKLCSNEGGPYQRIRKWCEDKIAKIPNLPAVVKTDMDAASEQYRRCFELMKSRNAKYGDSWKRLRLSAIIDLMIMKLDRCQKQELDNHAIEVEIEDVVNYGIFGLMKIRGTVD